LLQPVVRPGARLVNAAGVVQVLHRVHNTVDAALVDLEVGVNAGDVACRALVADVLAGLHLVPDLHLRTAHGVVPVVGPQAGAVVQVDADAGLAGDGIPADPLHHTR